MEYKMIEKDPTIQKVRKREKSFGLQETKPLQWDESYEQLGNEILENEEIINSRTYPQIGIDRKSVLQSIKLWEELGITLQDIRILMNYSRIQQSHPSNLPITWTKNKNQSSGIQCYLARRTANNEMVPIFMNVELPIYTTEITSSIYAHEIAHSQLLRVGEGTQDIYNTEMIPIWMEFLFANQLDPTGETLKRMKYFRLAEMGQYLQSQEKIEDIAFISKVQMDTYIQSILEAIQLTSIYLSSPKKIQQEMIWKINQVFQGNLLVEDILGQYDSDLESTSKDIKVLKKI